MSDKSITIDFLDLDFKKLTFSEMKQNKYGGNFVNIIYDGKIADIKFPRMQAPFGISTFEDKKTGDLNYNLETSFDNLNDTSNLKEVYEKALKFDEFIIKTVAKHHKEWLNEDEKPDIKYLKKSYTPFVKVPVDKQSKKPLDYPSRCKAGFYVSKNGEFTFSLFSKGSKVPITTENYSEYISPRDDIKSLRRLKNIWFSNMGGFGVAWELRQIVVYRNNNANTCMLDVSDKEDEDSDEESETSSQASSLLSKETKGLSISKKKEQEQEDEEEEELSDEETGPSANK